MYPGCLRWCPGDCLSRQCYAPVFASIENDSNRGETGATGVNRDNNGANRGSLWPIPKACLTLWRPCLPWWIPGVPEWPGAVSVTHSLRRIILVIAVISQWYHGLSWRRPGFILFLISLWVYPGSVVLNILIEPGRLLCFS